MVKHLIPLKNYEKSNREQLGGEMNRWFENLNKDLYVIFKFSFHKIIQGYPGYPKRSCLLLKKKHVLDNNSHEFHIFWVVIMPKTLN